MEVTAQQLHNAAKKLVQQHKDDGQSTRTELYYLQQDLAEFISLVILECNK